MNLRKSNNTYPKGKTTLIRKILIRTPSKESTISSLMELIRSEAISAIATSLKMRQSHMLIVWLMKYRVN